MKTASNSRVLRIIPVILILVLFCPLVHSKVINVDDDGQTDFDNIQAGIDAVDNGDTVLVAPGEYVITEPITFRGKAITVRSEAGPEQTTIRMSEASSGWHNDSAVVLFDNGEGAESLLEGLTLTGSEGSGISCVGSSPSLENCVMKGNYQRGVQCVESASPTITNCTISGSVGDSGVNCRERSSPTITNCTIWGNSAIGSGGGGVYCNDSSPTIINCIISGNDATRGSGGGGVQCIGNSSPTLANCTIAENSAYNGGGVYFGEHSSPVLVNCIVWANAGGSFSISEASIYWVLRGGGWESPAGGCRSATRDTPGPGIIGNDLGVRLVGMPDQEGFTLLGDNAQGYPEYSHDQTGIVFVLLPGGTFSMGAQSTDSQGLNFAPNASSDEAPVHAVTLSPFLIAKYECTQDQWEHIMGSNPSFNKGCGNCPVESVSWDEIQRFEAETGLMLPTEAQWEYACRAGTNSVYGGTGVLDDMGWYARNSGGGTHPVGQKQPNHFGLHDTHGNVWEWCEDVYHPGFYAQAAAMEPDPISTSGPGPDVTYCCLETEGVWPGEGNINADPLFCGGWETAELMVSNQQEFEDAFESFHVDFALSTECPCLGTGEGGVDMGADMGVCDDPLPSQLLIHLAEGVYNISDLSLVHNVSIEGAGEEETVIEGTVHGLRTGATLSHVTVRGEGTGIHVEGGEAPEILNCTITTGNSGPGVSCSASSPVLTNCMITGNSAPGGGVRCHDSSAPVLTNCTITENPGGGLNCWGSSPVLINCTITGNSANDGAGVSCYDSSSPVLINCTITGNLARSRWGGGFDCSNSSPLLTSCIVWGNVGGSIDLSGSSNPQISFSCTEGGFPGEGNIDADPLFAALGYWHDNNTPDDPGDDYWVDGDYHLKSQAGRWDPNSQSWVLDDVSSPCIDTGDPNTCIGFEPNPNGDVINMGAYGGTKKASMSPSGIECMSANNPNYDEWIQVGAPACWCHLRQCHGDTDCKAQGKQDYWVSTDDLDILIAAWNKPFTEIEGQTVGSIPLICADFDHEVQGKNNYRVSINDLDILIVNWNIADKPYPDCP